MNIVVVSACNISRIVSYDVVSTNDCLFKIFSLGFAFLFSYYRSFSRDVCVTLSFSLILFRSLFFSHTHSQLF